MRFRIKLLLLFCLCTGKAFSQRTVWGRLLDDRTKAVIDAVTVANISSSRFNESDQGGNFKISVKPGDTLVFSSVSYVPDTLVISRDPGASLGTIYLKPRSNYLAAVTVFDNRYSQDSLERRNYHRKFLDSTGFAKIINDSTVAPGGFGLTLSPLSYFSRKQKDSRQFKKHLAEDERQAYIESRYARPYVARVTGLTGDSLQTFYWRYRPGYAFCRKASHEDILLYINKQLIAFRKGEPLSKKKNRSTG